MAYTFLRDIRLHSAVVVFVCVAQTAFAQRDAAGVRYHIAGATVAVAGSTACTAEGAFLLSAHLASMDAALDAHGARRAPGSAHDAPVLRYHFSSMAPDQRYRALDAQKLAQEVDGRPLWCVQPVAKEHHGTQAPACQAAADEPWSLLTHGLAHVSMVPYRLQAKAKNQGAQEGFVRRIDLRHAAGELEPRWTTARLPHAAAAASSCVSQDAAALPALTPEEVADSVVWHSAESSKRLALTFDACSTYSYGPFNPEVIAALEAADVPATLFVGGHWAEMHPDTLRALAQNPLFEIGNHTYSHPHMRDLTPWQQAQELRWTQALIYNVTGVTPRVFRPPYGEVDDVMLQEVARAGLTTVEYDLPAGDADVHVSPMKLTQWVVGQAQAGSIVIMHMNRPKNHTAQALPMIVKALRDKGFTFCQMGDLLHDGGARCR